MSDIIYLATDELSSNNKKLVLKYNCNSGEKVFIEDDSYWISGSAISHLVKDKIVFFYLFNNTYFFEVDLIKIELSKDVTVFFKDGNFFSVFKIYKNKEVLFKYKYFNKILLNPFFDPRNRDDVDSWYNFFLNIELGFWKKLPWRKRNDSNDFEFKNQGDIAYVFNVLDESC